MQAPPAQVRLGFALIEPVVPRHVHRDRQGGGHLDEDRSIRPARFQHQHRMGAVRAQPIRQHAPGRAGPDDHIVEHTSGDTAYSSCGPRAASSPGLLGARYRDHCPHDHGPRISQRGHPLPGRFGAGGERRVKAALGLLDTGSTRAEIADRTGVIVGVAGADLTVPTGEICVLMGLSGSGKSTCCARRTGLIAVTRGEVLVRDGDAMVDVGSCGGPETPGASATAGGDGLPAVRPAALAHGAGERGPGARAAAASPRRGGATSSTRSCIWSA